MNGNLSQRQDLRQSLSETFEYDGLNRLDLSKLNGTDNLDVIYDLIGNITMKSDVCPSPPTPCYSYHATRKHAVIAAGGNTYGYDANGNVTNKNGAAIEWNSYNLPRLVNGSGVSSEFFYGPGRQRFKQSGNYVGGPETTHYVGGILEKVVTGSNTHYKHLIMAPTGLVATYVRRVNGPQFEDTFYFTHDHLGSIDSVSDAAGALKVRLSYGAFGKRRNEAGWAGAVPVGDLTGIANTTRHGYTEHEMLDNLTLIHMNGRVFDPTVGRFLSADPFVQAPDFSQSLNRYSYVWNNPLSFTDPSGFETEGGAPFRFGFGYGAVRVAHHRYPAPHMQPPPRRDAPVGRDTQGGAPEITGQSAADAGCLPSGAGATPNWNPAADACSDAAAHDETVDEEQRARAGRASGARAVAEISSEAADVADEYARDTVKYGALYYVLRWLGIGRAAKAAPNPPFRNGDVILRTFNTSKGPLDMAAEVQISGRTLHLKDVAVFPRGAESLSLGTREIAALRNQLADEARRLGFDQLRITGTRVTGANPGKQVDILIDLTGGP